MTSTGTGQPPTPDLSTQYLGFTLPHPVMPSSSPLTGDLDSLHRLVEAGAPAVVLPSLFEEQIELETLAYHFGLEFGSGSNPERAAELSAAAQQDIDNRWHLYEQMVHIHRTAEYAEEEQ